MSKGKQIQQFLQSENLTWRRVKLLLWILPFFHLFLAMLIHQRFGYFFLNITDPAYFHLMSGTAMSMGHLNTAYNDHPGTPIQIVMALAIRLANLVSNNRDIPSDVVQNPEYYLFAANLLYNILFLFVIAFVGIKATKYTKNIWIGILLQLGFFSHITLLRVTGRLIPEGFMLLPLALLLLLLLHYLYDENSSKHQTHYLRYFGLLVGWGLATKLSFVAFIIIPFFFLKGWKQNARYLLLVMVSFFIIAFPVLSNLHHFWEWGSNLFIHSGRWGGGQTNFMDMSAFSQRLRLLFHYATFLFILLFILLLENGILFIFYNSGTFFKKYFRVSLASIASVLLLALLVCKHFATYYFIPALLFESFFLFLILYPLVHVLRKKNSSGYFYFSGTVIALTLLILSMQAFRQKNFIPLAKQQQRLTTFQDKVTSNDILIISGYYAGTPFKAFAIANGVNLCGIPKRIFTKPLLNHYPNIYIYYSWAKDFYYWNSYVNSQTLLDRNRQILIYIGKGKEKDLQIIVDKFRKENPGKRIETVPVINTKQFQDKLYQLVVN